MVRFLLFLFLVALASGCSIEQNSFTSNTYHNLTAHYNGFYYGREKAREVEAIILKSLDDDPNEVLRLFPKLDTTLAKSYAKDTEEIIKMSSLSIQRHPNSKWVYENYILVGQARLYDCDFPNAIQTFKYVNTKSLSPDLRHQALVHLVRTFTENDEFDKAEEVFRFLEKEKMNKTNRKNLLMEKAYYYQVRGDYDNMVRNLTNADSLLTRHDRKGRIYFIIGQVYQQLGFGAEAYNYYRKCLATNPEYEIDFYARLNLAQVARLDDSRDVKTIRKQFDKLLTDAKNIEFRDKIYYELGEFERKQNHQLEAIDNYKLAAHAGTNKRIQGNAFLRIGQLYFDSLRKYSLAKSYYDSAIASLPREIDNYEAIKKRQEVLGDFVKYSETIVWQDSLLSMVKMDSAALHSRLDSVLAAREKKAEEGKKKKKRSAGPSNNNSNNPFFQTESTSTADWYFGNASAVSLGQSEFTRIWGSIALEDNWRRSNKTSSGPNDAVTVVSSEISSQPVAEKEISKEDQRLSEISTIFSQLPKSEEDQQKALAQIEEAYFMLGDLFFLQLNEKTSAAQSYEQLLSRFPESDHEAEVLYKLYLIEKDKPDGRPSYYADLLKENHPTSTFAKVLLNPDYLKETSVATEKQMLIYKEAYQAYNAGSLREAQEKTTQGLNVGETTFTPQLELLKILITGKTEDVTRYQFELGEFLKRYPDGALKPYAEQLLAASKTFLEKVEKSKGIRFANLENIPHYLVLVYDREDKITDRLSADCELFNTTHFKQSKLQTSNLFFNENYAITMVSELANKTTALDYFDKFTVWVGQRSSLASYKFDTFVISKENFQIFYRTKALDEYLTFFDRNYKKQNQ